MQESILCNGWLDQKLNEYQIQEAAELETDFLKMGDTLKAEAFVES